MEKRSKKRKILKWIIIVVVVIGVVGAVTGGGSSDSSSQNGNTAQNESNNGSENSDSSENKEKTYGIGETVKVGDIEYTVNSINSQKTVGTEYLNTKAQETFLVINLTLKNNGKDAIDVSDSFFKLKRDDKEYETNSEGNIYLEDSIIYTNINPDASLTGNICFDVTQDTIDYEGLQLQVQTGVFGTEKGLINLH